MVGVDLAKRWSLETYFRSQVLTHLRRKLHHRNASKAAIDAIRHIQIRTDQRRSVVQVLLPNPGSIDPEDLQPLTSLGDDPLAYEILKELPKPLNGMGIEARLGRNDFEPKYRPKPVLVVPVGRSAKKIGRLLVQTDGQPRFLINPQWPSRMFEIVEARNIEHLMKLDPKDFSLVVSIVGDDLDEPRLGKERDALRFLIERQKSLTPVLFAPALPLDRPSRHLHRAHRDELLDLAGHHLLLDTSAVRSPMWFGNRSQSMNRRTADLITQTCLILLSSHDTLSRVRKAAERPSTCLSVWAVSQDIDPQQVPSEAVNLGGTQRRIAQRVDLRADRNLTPEIFDSSFDLNDRTVSDQRRGQFEPISGTYEISTSELNGDDFSAVVSAALDKALTPVASAEISIDDFEIRQRQNVDLRFPEMSAFVRLRGDTEVLITAEAPSLSTILAYEQEGISVIRYTDTDALRRLLRISRGLPFTRNNPELSWRTRLPREIRPFAQLRGHLPIFSKPWDANDIRVEMNFWQEWKGRFPSNPLIASSRIVLPGEDRRDRRRGLFVSVPRDSVREAIEASVAGASEINEESSLIDTAYRSKPRVYARPETDGGLAGIHRWVIRAGQRPIVPRILPPGLAAHEGWIVFDGDHYAAAVVASDVFDLWLRGHANPTNSAIYRQSNERVWNAFPWAESFIRIARDDALVMRDNSSEFRQVADQLSLPSVELDDLSFTEGELERQLDPAIRFELGQAYLRLFGFKPTYSEAQALTYLRSAANFEPRDPERWA
jgi:hypothetical protein